MASLSILPPTLQLGFYRRLVEAQNAYLLPALLDQVSKLDIGQLDDELKRIAGNEKLSFIARKGFERRIGIPGSVLDCLKTLSFGLLQIAIGLFPERVLSRAIRKI